MTKKLEELLNLPDSKEIIETAKAQESEQKSYELEKQQELYKKLMKQAYKLQSINRSNSDQKYLEADKVLKKIDALKSK